MGISNKIATKIRTAAKTEVVPLPQPYQAAGYLVAAAVIRAASTISQLRLTSSTARGKDFLGVRESRTAHLSTVSVSQREGGGRDDDDPSYPVPQQHLLDDQAGLDRLAQAHVVGDEEVDSGHRERLGYRLELVLLDRDSAAERCLEGLLVGAGDSAPADGVEEGAELLRVVVSVRGDTAAILDAGGPQG
jgi:hypothetical protein